MLRRPSQTTRQGGDLPSYGGLDVSNGPDHSYGSGYGHSRTASSGYSRYGGPNNYKDKPGRSRHHGENPVLRLLMRLKEPQIWPIILSIFFFITTLHYRSKYNSVLKIMDVTRGGVKEARDAWDGIVRTRDNQARSVSSLQEQQRKIVQKQTACDNEKRQLTKERDELRMKYQSPDKLAEQQRLVGRQQKWKEQVANLQAATARESRKAVTAKYGPGPHFVEFTVQLETLPEERGTFVIEMAPLNLMPHAVYVFLEQVSNKLWSNAWFYVNGPHVLQAGPKGDEEEIEKAAIQGNIDERSVALLPFTEKNIGPLAFQEYAEEYPHVSWTLGFTGRPAGPDWYINKIDNTAQHGPGGQFQRGDDEEADPCFAKVVSGFDTVKAVMNMPVLLDDPVYKYFYEEPIHITKAVIVSGANGTKDGAAPIKIDRQPQQQQLPQNTTESITDDERQWKILAEQLLQQKKGEKLTPQEEQWMKMAEQLLKQQQQSQQQGETAGAAANVATGDTNVVAEPVVLQEERKVTTTSSKTERQKPAASNNSQMNDRSSQRKKRKFKKPLIEHMVEP